MSFPNLSVRTFLLLTIVQFACVAQTIEPVLQPLGLQSGDQYRLVFVTSQQRDATSTNIDDYNEFVQSVADASPIVGSWGLEWKAIASTVTVDARDNIGAGPDDQILPVYRLDGIQFVAPGNGPLFEFESDPESPRIGPVMFTELGTIPPASDSRFILGAEVWTGTDSEGTAADILGPLGGNDEGAAAYGDSLDGRAAVYFDGSQPVTLKARFYGISSVAVSYTHLTLPTTPYV